MNTNKLDKKTFLSTLWIFVSINYIFCDLFTLFYSEEIKRILTGKMGETVIDQNFLLTFAVILEIPILLILLSRTLSFKINRIANIFAGIIMTIVQAGSLTSSSPTKHYVFFSSIEIVTTLLITIYAFNWKKEENELRYEFLFWKPF